MSMENLHGIVYHAFCTVNGKAYVGQTTGPLEDRRSAHLDGTHGNCRAFKRALEKHGHPSFVWTILGMFANQRELDEAEMYWIRELGTLTTQDPGGYNIREGGSRGRHSPETIEKIRRNNLGQKRSEETKRKLSESHKGKVSWNKGKTATDEARENMREAQKKFGLKGEQHPMFGKKHSEKTKKLMSRNRTGRVPWNKGRPMTDEQKTKISQTKLSKRNSTSDQKREVFD